VSPAAIRRFLFSVVSLGGLLVLAGVALTQYSARKVQA
jgi:hypothetical protein